MNCEKMRNKILLAESGELTEREERKLESHLAVCADCQMYRENERKIVSAALNSQIVKDIPQDVLARICSAGKKRKKSEARIIVFRPIVMQVLAYAAVLALFVGGWTMLKYGNEQTSRMNEIGVILDMVSNDTMMDDEYESAINETSSLKELADQLLIIEGLMADDLIDGLYEEDLIEDSQPAVLQSRNIPALCVKRCA